LSQVLGFAAQGDDPVRDVHIRLGGPHVAVKQQHGLHLHADPTVGMLGGALAFDLQLIVHALDAGQAFDGVLGQGLVGTLGDGSGQGDGTVLGFRLNRIVLEVSLEDVGILGGRLDAVIRLRGAQ